MFLFYREKLKWNHLNLSCSTFTFGKSIKMRNLDKALVKQSVDLCPKSFEYLSNEFD